VGWHRANHRTTHPKVASFAQVTDGWLRPGCTIRPEIVGINAALGVCCQV
jgi:hypothetical protein